MKVSRKFTEEGKSPYETIPFEERVSEIKDSAGSIIFRQEKVRVPAAWSQIATDILAQKYFRKSGVPLDRDDEGSVQRASGKSSLKDSGGESSAEQVFHRLAHTWTDWGRRYGYFNSEDDSQAFYDEICFMLASQMAAPNSPQWFNTGLYAVYGIRGPEQGHFYVDPSSEKLRRSETAYERPQPHACFILNVKDSLLDEGGIMDLVKREARIFKYGSGSGSNFSRIRGRGEELSGGGKSSGLLSFLKINDRSASAIKSGGTTRRAAKMVTLDADHPDIEEYIDWKVDEEHKVASLVTGSRILRKYAYAIMAACRSGESGTAGTDPAARPVSTALSARRFGCNADSRSNPLLAETIREALEDNVPANYIGNLLRLAGQGIYQVPEREYSADWEEGAYTTVSGQSSNNSVRITSDFMRAVSEDSDWKLVPRTGKGRAKTVKARDLWEKIAISTWRCADPGLQFHSTINEWHTCPSGGDIRASNPCSEYMFLDDTACNLASLNLVKFYNEKSGEFDLESYRHAIRLWTIALEISVLMAHYPSREIARNSYDYRTLGIGFANLGALLMLMGIPYDSDEGRNAAGALGAILTAESYAVSAEMAGELGPFPGYSRNRDAMLRVIRNHRRAAYNNADDEYEGLSVLPTGLDQRFCPAALLEAARRGWDRALELGQEHGFRNAQVSALAPTGTIGLLMDCDTTGIEPDFALVKSKKLAGGGSLKIVNQSMHRALRRLGYSEKAAREIETYCRGHGTIKKAPGVSYAALKARGFTDEVLRRVEKLLPNSFSLRYVLTPPNVGEDFIRDRLKIPTRQYSQPDFDLLESLGFSEDEINAANRFACGAMRAEGAPYLEERHFSVFDTASGSISWKAHIDMIAAVQPFISGSVSKTINMPSSATVEEIQSAYRYSWRRMLKAIAIYRDGSKMSQPLSAAAKSDTAALAVLSTARGVAAGGAGVGGDVAGGAGAALESPHRGDRGHDQEKKTAPCQSGRKPLPNRRGGYTQKAKIGNHSIFLRTGEYEGGALGEIFLDMHKEGAAFRSLLNSFAIAVSLGLQYGVPLEEYVDAFTFTRFEPNGIVRGHDNIKMTTSVLDFIFRDLALTYLKRTDLAQVKPDDLIATTTMDKDGGIAGRNSSGNAGGIDIPGGNSMGSRGKNTAGSTDQQGLPVLTGLQSEQSQESYAQLQGYTGDPCPTCGHFTLVRNGTCSKCRTCGTTTGCS